MGRTALSLAASHGRLAVVDLLLKAEGIDVASRDCSGETALCVAARDGHDEIVKRIAQDPRARIYRDLKDAIEVAANCSIKLFLQRELG
jgi:ankyrin repeat protein